MKTLLAIFIALFIVCPITVSALELSDVAGTYNGLLNAPSETPVSLQLDLQAEGLYIAYEDIQIGKNLIHSVVDYGTWQIKTGRLTVNYHGIDVPCNVVQAQGLLYCWMPQGNVVMSKAILPATPCIYEATPDTINTFQTGGTYDILITTSDKNCLVNPVIYGDWISKEQINSLTGDMTLRITIAPSTASRTGSITVGGIQINIIQTKI